MSPVAVESGRRKVACFRRGCDHRLREATSTLADATRHWHPWAADRYAATRARGHDHPRAIRTLGRARCRVIWCCWQDRTPYDPGRATAACNSTSPSPSPAARDPGSTSPPPSGWLGAAVTHTAARRAERAALDGKPTTATPPGG